MIDSRYHTIEYDRQDNLCEDRGWIECVGRIRYLIVEVRAAFVGLLADCDHEHVWRGVPSTHYVNNFFNFRSSGRLPTLGIINIVTVVGIDYITACISGSSVKP